MPRRIQRTSHFGQKAGQRPYSGQQTGPERNQKYWFFIHFLKSARESLDGIEEGDLLAADEFPSTKKRRIEAALFLAKEGLSSRKLAKLTGLADATEARTLIRELNEEFDQQGRAFRVEEVAGGYMLMTRGVFADWLRKLKHVPAERRLSQTALETLSIVAYRQPVLRAEIEAIRGVGCSEVLKQLMEFDLVRISGRSEELGRPYLYGTTHRFLQMFGLRSVDRLPRVSWVNESRMSIIAPEIDGSELEESTVTQTFPANTAQTALLEESVEEGRPQTQEQAAAIEDEENEDWQDEIDDEDDDWDDDDDWADDDDEDSDEESLDEDDEEEDKWEEVDDDDDGWVDDDDDDEDDVDDWGEDGDDEDDGEDDDWD